MKDFDELSVDQIFLIFLIFLNIVNISNSIKVLHVRTIVVMGEVGRLDTESKVVLFNSQRLGLLAVRYGTSAVKSLINKLNCDWRECPGRVLDVNPLTHDELISGLMFIPPLEATI